MSPDYGYLNFASQPLKATAVASVLQPHIAMALDLDLYSDEWIRVMRPDGALKLAVRAFHVCLAGERSA